MVTEFMPWYQSGQRINRCLTCGSLVMEGDSEVHTKWHEEGEKK